MLYKHVHISGEFTFIVSMESFSCVKCSLDVRPRQEATMWDVCERWQHRTCDTGKIFIYPFSFCTLLYLRCIMKYVVLHCKEAETVIQRSDSTIRDKTPGQWDVSQLY